ncbi:glycosyl transferase [bacterium]|nr:glycosyl transferase [bacterium]|tara:strand:- start:950 stop:1777 length:828 start_codon:yes stop_codon:yes gene_type:complete
MPEMKNEETSNTVLTVLVLTYNEEKNLGTCLKSVQDVADEIIIVDSFSTDTTADVAKMYHAKVVTHEFENQADQTNWALGNVEMKGDWILRIDADEYLTKGLAEEIKKTLPITKEEITGYEMNRRVHFLGKWVRHGGYYPIAHLRLWRRGKVHYEEREVDEHANLLEGRAGKLRNDFVDDNKNGIGAWIEKHNAYAEREAREAVKEKTINKKQSFYYKLPMFWRARFYYWYRMIFRLGILDKKEGRLFHYLQAYWYRMLIDAKLYEMKKQSKHDS